MTARVLSPILLSLVLAFALNAQVTGRFTLNKDSYAVGEPLTFTLEVANDGPDVVYLFPKTPGQCSETFQFWLSGTPPQTSSYTCGLTWHTGCGDEPQEVKPGEVYAAQWPLDFWYRIEHPGNYKVSIARNATFTSLKGGIRPLDIKSEMQLNIVPGDPAQVEEVLRKFRADLQDPDPNVQHNALDVLATTAPSYYYDDALRLARSDDAFAVEHAVGALGRINTPEARAVLAEVITTRKLDKPNEENARCDAIEELGQSGDASYVATLLPYAGHSSTCESYYAMRAIAALGRGSVVSELQNYLRSDQPKQRLNAVESLRITASPEAVDALIGALRDKDAGVRDKAAASLIELTGHSVTKPGQPAPSPTQLENLWRAWWHSHRQQTTLNEPPPTICRMP